MERPDPDPPTPAVAQRDTVARRLARWAASVLDLGLLGLVLCWLLGQVVSDRAIWSQYLGWIPTEIVVVAGVVILAVAAVLRGRRPRPIPLAVIVVVVLWMGLAEWRLHRLVLPGPAPGDLRVVFMNISPKGRSASIQAVFDAHADVVVLSNVHPQRITFEKIYGFPPVQLMERSIGMTPGESPPGEAHLLRYGMFHVYSKHPIRRRVIVHVGDQETWIDGDIQGGGSVLMVEIDAPDGPFVLWAVDMPRTLGASRRRLFEETAGKIKAVTRVQEIDAVGRWALPTAQVGRDDPIFAPDLVLGDFNTPSHAWSVGLLAPRLRPARADAGVGPAGTFPAAWPLLEIDFSRLGRSVSAARLERVRCTKCRHLGLLVDLERAEQR